MTGKQRLVQLGFNPDIGSLFVSPGGLVYELWFSANMSYSDYDDSFLLLQVTGLYSGRGKKIVKAKNLMKWTQTPSIL